MNPASLYLGILLLLLILGLLAVHWLGAKRLRGYAADQAARIEELEHELNAVLDGTFGVGNRLEQLERDLKALREIQQRQEQKNLGDLPYNEAMRMAARGASVEELTEQCGLSRSEADLVLLLHKESPPVVTPEVEEQVENPLEDPSSEREFDNRDNRL